VISSFGKLARGGRDARIICDIDLQKGRFPAFLRDLIRRFATGVLIAGADEDMKSLSRELTRDFIANPLIRPVINTVFIRGDSIILNQPGRPHSRLATGPSALAVDWRAIPLRRAIFS
jgi:hypothetical protein